MNLSDKVALVTGAGSGIGKVTAQRFAKDGAKVAVLSHTADEINKTADEIKKAGGEAMAIVADVSNPKEVEQAVEETVRKFGKLDILFANAGINGVWAPIEELTPEEWNKTITTNLTGTFLPIHYAVPHMKKNKGGSILITASVNGTRTFTSFGATAYSTTKAGQLAMGKMLALELAAFNIRVNVICPGAVETEISENTEKRHVDKIKIKSSYGTTVPLSGKPASADQVADLAIFLVSDAASHITGTPVWIDGGSSLLM